MTTKRRHIIKAIIFLIAIILADYSPLLYYKVFPNPGSWPNFYNYHQTSSTSLMTAIANISDEDISIAYFPDTRKNSDRYTRVVFLDKTTNDYFHCWVLTDATSMDNFTQIVFGYVSKSADIASGKRINTDFDFVTNYLVKRRFESLVIGRLKIDGKISA